MAFKQYLVAVVANTFHISVKKIPVHCLLKCCKINRNTHRELFFFFFHEKLPFIEGKKKKKKEKERIQMHPKKTKPTKGSLRDSDQE